MPIIDLQRRLVEVGRIRMGRKEGNRPVKLDTWRLTSGDRARLEEAAELYGGTVAPWDGSPKGDEYELVTTTTELPILLLPGQALSQWHELWSGGGCQRRCDGAREILSDKPCLCDAEGDERKCKPTTRLSVMLPDVPGLGCWRLESHGYYAAVELGATAAMLEQATAQGQVFPARLRIDQRRQVKDGKTTRYAVPVLDIDVRFGDAVRGIAGPTTTPEIGAPRGHKPIAQLPAAEITVKEAVAIAEAEPKVRAGKQSAPIPANDDIPFGDPIPVEPDEPIEVTEKTTPPLPPALSKKLDVLVATLRKNEPPSITTEQLYASLAKSRGIDADIMVDLIGGRDNEGVVHWKQLRESLTEDEAKDLADRLGRLDKNIKAQKAAAQKAGATA